MIPSVSDEVEIPYTPGDITTTTTTTTTTTRATRVESDLVIIPILVSLVVVQKKIEIDTGIVLKNPSNLSDIQSTSYSVKQRDL